MTTRRIASALVLSALAGVVLGLTSPGLAIMWGIISGLVT